MRIRGWLGVLALTAAVFGGCKPKPVAEPLPKSRDLARPRVPTTSPNGVAFATRRVEITRLELPADASLEKAWAATISPAVDAPLVDLWAANGLRLRELDASSVQAFSKALPATLEAVHSLIISDGHGYLAISPNRVTRAYRVPIVEADGSVRELRLPAGLARFLLKVTPLDGGGTTVELIPQHYWPRETLLPRPPQESELDGEVLRELGISAPLRDKTWLVIGLEAPAVPATQPATQPETSDSLPTSQPGDPAATQPTEPRIKRAFLADLLLRTSSGARPSQVLLIIGEAADKPAQVRKK